MELRDFLRPWSGWAFRHIPADSPHGVLDFRFAGRGADNRWNGPGEPTLYLAGDRGVAVAEFARHLREERAIRLSSLIIRRQVFRLAVDVPRALDLRDPALVSALSLREAPRCFLDRAVARSVAAFLRVTTDAQALILPSVAFLDDPNRFVLALFLEKLPAKPKEFVLRAEPDGFLTLEFGEEPV